MHDLLQCQQAPLSLPFSPPPAPPLVEHIKPTAVRSHTYIHLHKHTHTHTRARDARAYIYTHIHTDTILDQYTAHYLYLPPVIEN